MRSFPLPRAGPDQERGPCCRSASCKPTELAETQQTTILKQAFSSFSTDSLLLSFSATNRFHILNPSFKKAEPSSLSSHLTVTAVRRCRIQTRTPNLWAWLCLSYNILAIFIHYRDLKKEDFFFSFPKNYFRETANLPWILQQFPAAQPPATPSPFPCPAGLPAAAQGCPWAQHRPPLLHRPRYQCALMPLAIFGSRAQKYARDINNSFLEVGPEDTVLSPASSTLRDRTWRQGAGTPPHCRTPAAPCLSPTNIGFSPFARRKGRRGKQLWWQPSGCEAGHVFNTNYCCECWGSTAEHWSKCCASTKLLLAQVLG